MFLSSNSIWKTGENHTNIWFPESRLCVGICVKKGMCSTLNFLGLLNTERQYDVQASTDLVVALG